MIKVTVVIEVQVEGSDVASAVSDVRSNVSDFLGHCPDSAEITSCEGELLADDVAAAVRDVQSKVDNFLGRPREGR